MRQLVKVVTLLVLVALLAAPVAAQDKQKRKGKRGQQQRGAAMQLMKKLEKAKLTDDQKGKIKKVVAKFEPKLKELAAELKPAPGQREAVAAARKKAEADGKKGKELREAVTAAMNLTDKQKELRKKQQTMQREMQKEVMALLTPEQLKIVQPARKRGNADKANKKGSRKGKESDK